MPSDPGLSPEGHRPRPLAERAPAAAGRAEPGRVASFDAEAGLGTVAGSDGRPFPFHCTAITDGTRRIDEGCAVIFAVGPGGPGRWEAVAVTPV